MMGYVVYMLQCFVVFRVLIISEYILFASLVSENVLDLVFVVEGSRHVSPQLFMLYKNFIISVISKFDISDTGSHVSLVEYSDKASIVISLKDFQNPESLELAVERVKASRGLGVVTDQAIGLVASQVYTLEHGARPGVRRVVIVLTRSPSTGSESLRLSSQALAHRGARMIVIYTGEKDNFKLKNRTSDGVFNVPQNADFDILGSNIANKIMSDIEKGSEPEITLDDLESFRKKTPCFLQVDYPLIKMTI